MSVTLKKITVRQIVIIGLMAALCLVSNYFSFPVPIGIDKSRIHLGNVFCILSAFMLGPVGGGLARALETLEALRRGSVRFSTTFLPDTAQNASSPLSISF